MQNVCIGEVFAESRLSSVFISAELLPCSQSTQLFKSFFLPSARLEVGLYQGLLFMSFGHTGAICLVPYLLKVGFFRIQVGLGKVDLN